MFSMYSLKSTNLTMIENFNVNMLNYFECALVRKLWNKKQYNIKQQMLSYKSYKYS